MTKSIMMRMPCFCASVLHLVEIFQRAVHGVDVFVVGNVIAEVDLRRGIAGRDPDRIHSQTLR